MCATQTGTVKGSDWGKLVRLSSPCSQCLRRDDVADWVYGQEDQQGKQFCMKSYTTIVLYHANDVYRPVCRFRSNVILFSYSKGLSWSCLMRVDCSSSRPQVDDTLRHAQWLSGRRSGWSHDAEVLSLWRHGQRRQPHGVHWKTYVNVRPWFLSVLLLLVIRGKHMTPYCKYGQCRTKQWWENQWEPNAKPCYICRTITVTTLW